jgi:hypothetical protein
MTGVIDYRKKYRENVPICSVNIISSKLDSRLDMGTAMTST